MHPTLVLFQVAEKAIHLQVSAVAVAEEKAPEVQVSV